MFNNESMVIKHGTYVRVSVRQCVSPDNEDLMRTENHKKKMRRWIQVYGSTWILLRLPLVWIA